MKRVFKILLIGIIVLIILAGLSIGGEKKKPVLVEPYKFDDNFSKEYIALVKRIELGSMRVGEIKRITQTGSFVNENSPFYLTVEEYQEGKEFKLLGKTFKTSEANRLIYLKGRLEVKEGERGLMNDLIKYRIMGRACNLEKEICYEISDKQEPELEDIKREMKKDIKTRYYYWLGAVPKDEKVATLILAHLSFSGKGFLSLGQGRINDLPIVRVEIFK